MVERLTIPQTAKQVIGEFSYKMFLREKEIPTFEWLKVYWGERIRLSKLSWGISGVGRVGKAWGPFLESPPDR